MEMFACNSLALKHLLIVRLRYIKESIIGTHLCEYIISCSLRRHKYGMGCILRRTEINGTFDRRWTTLGMLCDSSSCCVALKNNGEQIINDYVVTSCNRNVYWHSTTSFVQQSNIDVDYNLQCFQYFWPVYNAATKQASPNPKPVECGPNLTLSPKLSNQFFCASDLRYTGIWKGCNSSPLL